MICPAILAGYERKQMRNLALRYPALMRRARWLEKRINESGPERPGLSYDSAEYAEFLLAFQQLGVDFEPTCGYVGEELDADDADDVGLEAPPQLAQFPARGRTRPSGEPDTFVPGEPRRSGYYGRGGL